MAKKKTKKSLTFKSKETRIIVALSVLFGGIVIALSPFFEERVFQIFKTLFGDASLAWGLLVISISIRSFTDNEHINSIKLPLGLFTVAIATSQMLTYVVPDPEISTALNYKEYGGVIGYMLHSNINSYIGSFVEFLQIALLFLIGSSLAVGKSLESVVENFVAIFESLFKTGQFTLSKTKETAKKVTIQNSSSNSDEQSHDDKETDQTEEQETKPEPVITNNAQSDPEEEPEDQTEDINEPDIQKIEENMTSSELKELNSNSETEEPDNSESEDSNAEEKDPYKTPTFPSWKLPPSNLLQKPSAKEVDTEALRANGETIEKTLKSFNIEAQMVKITIGPTVVQYALSITEGTKVSKIRNLISDIAVSLATAEAMIRLEAPIPGTSLIGIEIPNPTPNFVYIKQMVDALNKNEDKYQLPLILGKNVGGQCIIQDLTKLPHLLVAGATGTGKSVGINSIITGLLMTNSPDELKMILVDPKMVELAPYNGIPHLLTPVITDMELVANALQWSVDEMLKRYRILKQVGARNIIEYNEKTDSNMPYIVIIIDEMADLMLSSGLDVESKIVRLAQMARAVGIHLILATQRPSVDVITGLIKANVPGRVAFSVSTAVDSRVIIDTGGAETLIGKGDMMFKSPQIGRAIRLQGALTDTEDTESIVDFIQKQVEEEDVDYQAEITKPQPGADGVAGEFSDLSEDELFPDALEIILSDGKASASMLQRRLRIGYNRAARIMDELEEAGAIGPQEGSSARDLLISSADQLLSDGSDSDSDE